MSDKFCLCFYKFIVDDSITNVSTVTGFVASVAVIVSGILLNYGMWNKLAIEKKKAPVWKRGNLVEPVMSCFCILQIIYWPYDLLYLWVNTNEVIPADYMLPWICNLLLILLKAGRICISYNSLFVALIRYFYIVHWKRANLWDFERIAKIVKRASIAIPVVMEIVGSFTVEISYNHIDDAHHCLTSLDNSRNMTNEEDLKPPGVEFALQYLPQSVITASSYVYITLTGLVVLNVSESFLYLRIFNNMKRYVM